MKFLPVFFLVLCFLAAVLASPSGHGTKRPADHAPGKGFVSGIGNQAPKKKIIEVAKPSGSGGNAFANVVKAAIKKNKDKSG